jgi:multidrug efflux pump subunit AcrA (membrane-fusion protein)
VTEAANALTSARDDLATATLTAPMTGTVASVGLVAGAKSGSNAIVVLAPGAAEVTVDVPLASIAKIKAGLTADVTPDGATKPSEGTVKSIGLLPAATTTSRTGTGTATASSTVAYPVVIVVPQAGGAFTTGSLAAASLRIGSADDVLTVPNSALARTATGAASVTVLAGGETSRRSVKTGLTGATTTEIASGLKAGERVVLADLTAELPTNSTTSRNRFGTGRGGFGGQPTGFRPR